MRIESQRILGILDRCCDAYRFPALDNGYVYLAGTRMSRFRSTWDWAIVIEVFGFSPRAGLPDTHIYTFASRLHDRDPPEQYVTREAYKTYLTNNPHNDSRFICPIDDGDWFDKTNGELVAPQATTVTIRGIVVPLPPLDVYSRYGIELETPPRVQVFESCRYLAAVTRDNVLASPDERRISVRPDMHPLLALDEWHHPDVVAGERPSESETFQRLADVLVAGDVGHYRPTKAANTHWSNWRDGGRV